MQGGDEDGAHVGRDGGGVGDDGDGGGEYSGEHAVEMRRVAHMMAKMGVVAAVVIISSMIDSELHSCRDSLTFASLLKVTSQTL